MLWNSYKSINKFSKFSELLIQMSEAVQTIDEIHKSYIYIAKLVHVHICLKMQFWLRECGLPQKIYLSLRRRNAATSVYFYVWYCVDSYKDDIGLFEAVVGNTLLLGTRSATAGCSGTWFSWLALTSLVLLETCCWLLSLLALLHWERNEAILKKLLQL